ncbi:YbbR domain-containing protein [Ureibacillus xyleni]|uniref:YbbR domain-containing protein n=1 Tax=Ureibacillus xyleni TaxID=614648 RepID=A0A285TP99_9BACL|nr:CdaR family protein [Ureibacillus xyleni]SOC24676.1 YbbR domain-containing protein [Ureibacillus xyleni]
MDKLFDSYWVLRVTALILAVLLFFYVKAQMDTSEQATSANSQMDIITAVPLEVYYDSENLIVSGLPKTVDVTIEGPMAIVLQTKLKRDFKVFVDLNSLMIGRHRVTIQHENFSEKVDVTIDPKIVDIVIEEKVTKELRIDPEMNNGLIAEGYELISMNPEPSTVFVTGAKSVIEDISYVKATVTGEKGINASFEQEAAVKVLDSSLNKLEVTIEPEAVNVKVDIREYSREVPVIIRQRGTPPEGITINSLRPDTELIRVYGPKSIIDALSELPVEFDISDIENSGSYEVDLVAPNGTTKLSTKKIKINANVTKDNNTETNEPVEQPVEENVEETDTENPANDEESTTQ